MKSSLSKLVTAAVCGLLALALSACKSTSGSKAVIRFWALGAEGENIQRLVPEFERRNPGIRVDVQSIPWTAAHEKLLTAYAGNSTPDVCQLGNTWIPEFVVLNAIEPLGQWLDHSSIVRKENYFPGIYETNLIDTVLYGIPWYIDTRVLFFRKDILSAAGFPDGPKTWQEWTEACRRIKSTSDGGEKYAILLPTSEWAPPVILGLQTGAALLKDRATLGDFSGSDFRRAFQFYIDFFRSGFAPIGNTQVANIYQGFAEGFFSMYITGPWNIGEFSRRLPPEMQDKWMTAPMPAPEHDSPGVSLAGGSSLVVFRSSKNKSEAWRFIEYLSEPSQQIAFYKLTGDLPAHREAWKDSSLVGNPYVRAFFRQFERVKAPPKIPEWEQIAMKVQDYAEAASRAKMSVEEALAALDRDVNVMLEKRRYLMSRK